MPSVSKAPHAGTAAEFANSLVRCQPAGICVQPRQAVYFFSNCTLAQQSHAHLDKAPHGLQRPL